MRDPVLITGARGFVGRALAARLRRMGLEVHGTTRQSDAGHLDGLARVYTVTSPGSLESWQRVVADVRPAAVFHLASGVERPESPAKAAAYVAATLENAANLMEALAGCAPEALVLLGSGEEYGASLVPYREDSPERPLTTYGMAKLAVTTLGRLMRTTRGWPVVTARPSVVYGPGQPPGSFLAQLTAAERNGERVRLTPGDQTRDFLHVTDVVSALLLLAESPDLADVVNVSSGMGISLRRAAELAGKVAGHPLPLDFGALPYRTGEPMRYVLDSTRLRELFGWRPSVVLEAGLRELLGSGESSA